MPAPSRGRTRHRHALAVTWQGEVAAAALAARTAGHVLAAFTRSFYLRFGDGIVCIGSEALGQGPLNALYASDGVAWTDLAVGAPALWEGRSLRVGPGFTLDFSRARTWGAPQVRSISVANLRAGLDRLAQDLRPRSLPGFGPLIPCLCTGGPPAADTMADPVLVAAAPEIALLRRWLGSAARSAEAGPTLSGLIGLGPGLTPSGDDFLYGVIGTLHAVGRGETAARVAASVLPQAAASTNLISLANLRCAAAGQVSAVFADAIAALTHAGHGLTEVLDRIAGVGHSSGWDSLAGVALALATLCGRTVHAPSPARGDYFEIY